MKNALFFGFLMVEIALLWCKDAIFFWVFDLIPVGFLLRAFGSSVFASLICFTALGGATLGIIVGAIKGHTTGTGLIKGAGIGVITGAITAVHLFELMVDGESLSKIHLFESIMNGNVFIEWVSPAVLKAYQWQINALEISVGEIGENIYDFTGNGVKGLAQSFIKRLPLSKFQLINTMDSNTRCSICLRDMKDREYSRKLPNCGHIFHMECIDEWLNKNGSCPICRSLVCN